MSFARPTLTQLIDRAKDDINARLPGADSRLRRSTLGVLATVFAGAIQGVYGYLDFLARQILPDTAEGDYLERHASARSIGRKAATAASGQVVATGVNGSVIPLGAALQLADGIEYLVQSAVLVAAGVAVLDVAARKAGSSGLAATGVRLSFVSPIAGVAAVAVVAAPGLTGGGEEETDEQLRARLLARIRQAPQGGADYDYVDWATQVAGVTRAWAYPGWGGAGTVGLTFMMDGREDPLPAPGDVAVVDAYVQARRPVTADLITFAPIEQAIPITISGLNPDDAATRAAVLAEIEDLLYREAQPGGTIPLTHFGEAISSAAGEQDHLLIAPAANVVLAPGRIGVLGAVTWL